MSKYMPISFKLSFDDSFTYILWFKERFIMEIRDIKFLNLVSGSK